MSIEAIPKPNSDQADPAVASGAVADHRSLAAALAPMLIEGCDGRLGPVTWFKADWQHGGAATATSTFTTDDGASAPVVLKVPVVGRELVWLRRLQDAEADADGPIVPRLYASGEAIGGYDLTWAVMERFPHGPLGAHWHDNHVERVADAAARFHHAASVFAVDQPPRIEDWTTIVAESVESVKVNRPAHVPRWRAALKELRQRLDPLVAEWRARDTKHWLHGDLHFANAMSRASMDEGPVCLIDLAEVHAGHWVEDAVYLERQLWTRPDRVKTLKPVRALAAARRRRGLAVEDDYARLAMIRRCLLAASAPKFIRSEGHPAHLAGCLDWLERGLRELV